MKKILKSKGFLVTAFFVSCIAILAACWLARREPKTAFLPDEQPPDATQEEWKDTPKTAEDDSRNHTDAGIPGQSNAEEKLEEYPKVAEESKQEVVIDFVPAETKDETPPPAPETPPSPTDNGMDNTPAAGSTNENGAVYDPVFGWVVPGQVNQSTVDSSGDPDKMVGNMGN